MNALDLIEKRIDCLNNLLGAMPSDDDRSENLTDSLISANTLISSSISGRTNINNIVKRQNELENYLNPDFLDEQNLIKSKEVYVNTIAPELAGNFELLEKIKAMEKETLGAENFRNIPDFNEKFNAMNEISSDQKQRNDLLQENLLLAMERYSEIQNNIKKSLQDMNQRIDTIENKLIKKKPNNDI